MLNQVALGGCARYGCGCDMISRYAKNPTLC